MFNAVLAVPFVMFLRRFTVPFVMFLWRFTVPFVMFLWRFTVPFVVLRRFTVPFVMFCGFYAFFASPDALKAGTRIETQIFGDSRNQENSNFGIPTPTKTSFVSKGIVPASLKAISFLSTSI